MEAQRSLYVKNGGKRANREGRRERRTSLGNGKRRVKDKDDLANPLADVGSPRATNIYRPPILGYIITGNRHTPSRHHEINHNEASGELGEGPRG